MHRVFVALWPPENVASALFDLANEYAGHFGGRASRRETIHLTLAFIGNVPSERLSTLVDVLGKVQFESFELHIDRLAYWAHNRLLWAGCASPPKALQSLVVSINRELIGNGFSIARPNEAFVPHLSLVRKLPRQYFPAVVELPREVQAVSWQCHDFVLVESMRSPEGSSYRERGVFHARP